VRASTNIELRAGQLSATLAGPDLFDVRWGSLHVAGRIQVTVRDTGWGTVPPVLLESTVERSSDSFLVELDAVHDDGIVAFAWHGRIEGRADGELTFSIDGVAEREFVYRRIGICVLHPWHAYVGAGFRATSGSVDVEGTFPREIVPQLLRDGRYRPMVEAFSVLRVHFPGDVGVEFAFEGERFELEDQRNWTDASFKTYPTPLVLSEPRAMRARERVVQRVTARVDGPPPAPAAVDDVAVVRIGERNGRRMPPVGLAASHGAAALHPAHLRVDVDVASGDVSALVAAASAGPPLEVALLVDDEGSGVEALAAVLADMPLARLLIHLSSGATIAGALVRSVRRRLGAVAEGVPVVGGTSEQFSEINRHPPDGVAVDAIAFSVSPTVHASDERSMMETLEIQGEVVRRAHVLSNDLPVVVSPIRLDAHLGTPFADAWTIGSVANLVAAGAASLTYSAAALALAHATELEGAELLDVTASQPQRVAALATATTVIVANLTPTSQPLLIDDEAARDLEPYEVRIL
jgi:hypothetical protein